MIVRDIKRGWWSAGGVEIFLQENGKWLARNRGKTGAIPQGQIEFVYGELNMDGLVLTFERVFKEPVQ